MHTISENITIRADINKIWAFLTDFSKSLSYNRFHTNLELPSNYSIGKMKEFNIKHDFGFGNYNMVAKITECIPPNRLCISEYCIEDNKKGFSHSIKFQIETSIEGSKMFYTVTGTYGGKVQDMSFKPILKSVMIEELHKIKNAIESSENILKPIITKTVNPF